jgi:Fungal specific transcription factor domain
MALPSTALRKASNALQLEAPGTSPEPMLHHFPTADILSWDIDPFEAMPDVTEHYLGHYFTNANTASYCMYPRDRFMEWVRRDREKTQAEKMLLYAMLAHGSVFSSKAAKTRNTDRKFFENIAREAMGKSVGTFSLPMVQTRLVLAMLHYALGNTPRSWDYCGMAIRAACGMKLNVEKGLQCITADERPDFGFDRATLIECRRRTFWSTYIMDRFSGFGSGHLCMLQNGNCLLRLPCDESAYARGEIPETPFFHTPIIDPKLSLEADRSGLGMMAHFVEVSAIWGDVLAQAYRSEYQPVEQYGEPAEEFHQQQMAKLENWKAGLSAHLRPSQDNIDRAFHGGYIGGFVSLWMLYHCAAMKLCRHVRFQYMEQEHIDRNLAQARHHAHDVLCMMPSLAKANREKRMPESAFIISTPFTSYGIFTSVDILTAAGSLREFPALLELLSNGSEVVEELAQYWSAAKRQWRMIGERFDNLLSAVHEGAKAAEREETEKTAFYAKKPMEVTFGLKHDLIYDVPLVQRMGAIGLKDLTYGGDELIEIKLQKQDAPPGRPVSAVDGVTSKYGC